MAKASISDWMLHTAEARLRYRSQQSQYWRYDNGAPTPTFQSGVVNSYDPYFRAGGAGTAFLVAGFGSYPGEYWALYFQNVASWTQ